MGSSAADKQARYERQREEALDAADPVGAVEIAARLGVERQTVDVWRRRHEDFPPRRWTVGGRPAWDWTDVAPWARARGYDA